ncbi:uncharacterized protein LOC120424496 [Culex pipiens pallens]|uniref:uncharacterized protein LOC120424496 n=1 Tax=Culex pipiens pallens TaxID=42434 RepID=UPI001954F542|nr:uncharacterized protein LOC120424496 [Culex pipiens pallens]
MLPASVIRWFDLWILLGMVVALLVEECHQVVALQLTEINVPDIVDYRHPVTMSCSYDLGENQLNSVKWYKGNEEFYRFAPMLNPRFKDFPVEGVQVVTPESLCNQFLCQIWLTNLSRHSSGQYRCEVSGDAPQFALANGSKNMTVEALPQHDPIISGHMVTYSPGDVLEANCTSDVASLSPRLYFFINEKAVPVEYLQQLQETSLELDGYTLKSRTLEMHLPLQRLFPKEVDHATLHIKCIATIDGLRSAGRESTAIVTVQSPHWLWIISRSGGVSSSAGGTSWRLLAFITLQLLIHRLNCGHNQRFQLGTI